MQPLDSNSVHRITSGQVVIDLQSAVKELVENSLDAGATAIDVRFQNYGLKSIEVVDNGSGIQAKDYDSIALKHYTSKLSSFEDLSRVLTFGFRGEALSSLCALTDGLTITTATSSDAPMGTVMEMDRNGKVRSKCKVARQRGTTVTVSTLFKPLPVRRKEFERNTKREFQKALNLLHAYALVPCALESKGVRFTVSNQTEGGRKLIQFRTDGSPSMRSSVIALWGPKALENIVDLNLSFDVETEKSVQRRLDPDNDVLMVTPVKVEGLVSKFTVGAGRTSVDRQFFFVNGRPYNPGKVQKAINEVYRTFNANQSPFVIANIILPTNACDINVSPDKRTIFLHSENNLVQALKIALETAFSSARSTYDVSTQPLQTQLTPRNTQRPSKSHTQTQEYEGGEKSSHHEPVPSTRDELVERDESSPHQLQSDDERDNGRNRPVADGECRPQSDDDTEPEPEPTLVAQPTLTSKGGGGDARDGTGWDDSEMNDRARERVPLFLPEPDDDMTGPVDSGGGQDGDERPHGLHTRSTIATSSVPSTPASVAPVTHVARSTTTIPDKPRSVQTVLSTHGAVWNLRRDGGADADGGRERKRARFSNEGDRVQTRKSSFRSSLSQFLGSGKKALPDEVELEDSGREGGDEEEVDELEEEDQTEERLAKGKRKRPRAGSDSSQGTMVVPSDDEHPMDIDEPPSNSKRFTAAPAPITQPLVEDVEELSEDEWDLSSTLVGTDVPPPDKLSSSSRPIPTPAGTEPDVVTLRMNLVDIATHYLDMYDKFSSSSAALSALPPSSTFRSAISSANLETAADDNVASAALSRIISKADFEHMVIVGQFNLGFIVVRKQGDRMDDLFIVDQHAADEKWNFETLQEKTVIASQKLFRPRELQFTAADEMLAIENMDVLRSNGFELERIEEQDVFGDEDEAASRTRLHLVAQPVSKDTTFDMKDLEELIHLMQDRPRGIMVRCSKARAMFAMRACRRSVMIGKALDKTHMTTIVRHMGTMDQPWNCPHGRPTMRHLSDLTSFGRYAPPRRVIDWEAFGMLGSMMEG